MQEFHTRSASNEGKKVPLFTPEGKISDHWFIIRGVDSDAFRKADTNSKRKLLEISRIENADERYEAGQKLERELVAVLVADWSFPEPCTVETVANFFLEAPQLLDMVNTYAARRSNFFAKGSPTSSTGQKASSSSKGSRKAPKARSART